MGVALEYQGEQHDRPVAFFGGEEAFKKNIERDRRKLAKCRRNGVRIIYVRQFYKIDEVISNILNGDR
ncbi:MAG: G:T-mismatch repair DNA endonuclease (very short patch repair protein) [Paracoccaceae bacterium]|jgi:G:T-mismatch repair DNA endonuclease (very short patch repair protein)